VVDQFQLVVLHREPHEPVHIPLLELLVVLAPLVLGL
jgi:hypothetical protein